VLGWPLQLTEQATTSFGASLLAAAGSVHPDLATASERMVRVTDTVEPVEQEREPLAERYSEMVSALANRGWIDDQLHAAAGGSA
jgi:ribulose kinase